jgi:hypothetical protein
MLVNKHNCSDQVVTVWPYVSPIKIPEQEVRIDSADAKWNKSNCTWVNSKNNTPAEIGKPQDTVWQRKQSKFKT